ncbi:hypothetical protein GCM10009819_02320 [Agromyces tropicus]|uniref:DUF3043 domain-containing protein n=1 Tax=Agromyces tropicus TaxID=555371 RepID=A0ABN2TW26_9MICO
MRVILRGTDFDEDFPVAKHPSTDSTSSETDAQATPKVGKGAPTPTRAEREAANRRPLVPNDRKEAARQARAKAAEARERARVGMAAGDERYLPARDRGPQKKFVRDYVDARFSIGEILIPVMFVVIVLTFVPSYEVQTIGIFALWGFFLVSVLDVIVLGFTLQRKLAAKFGATKVERFRWYAAMRALQLRPLRLPKPQVKRGQYPS